MSNTPAPSKPRTRASSAPGRLQHHPTTTTPTDHHFTIPPDMTRARLEAACSYLSVRHDLTDTAQHLTLRLLAAVRALRPLPGNVYAAPELSGFWRPGEHDPGTITLLTRGAQRLLIRAPVRRGPLHPRTDGLAPVTEDYLRMVVMLEEAEDAAGRSESEDEDGGVGVRVGVRVEDDLWWTRRRGALWRECGGGGGRDGAEGRWREAEPAPEMRVLEVLRPTDGEQGGVADDAGADAECPVAVGPEV